MCNRLHEDSKPIKKTGIGWKLFAVRTFKDIFLPNEGKKLLYSLCDVRPYSCNKTNTSIVRWQKTMKGRNYWSQNVTQLTGDGFGFFLSKKEAERTKRRWDEQTEISEYIKREFVTVIVKINYSGGLGQHLERRFFKGGWPVPIALCKSFKINSKEFVLK